MDHTQAQAYLLNKPFSSVGQPFGEGVDVFKVKDKMFATLAPGKYSEGEPRHWWLNLKCDPDEAQALRDIFTAVIPGYHMNKRLWNTVILDGTVPHKEIERMIDNSYLLVVAKMTKKQRDAVLVHL